MWRRRGPGYDVNNALKPPLCRKLVQLAEVSPGATVLDVCCGTGTVAYNAAVRAGADGSVVGIDMSEAMLEQVRSLSSQLRSEGAAHLSGRRLSSGQSCHLPDAEHQQGPQHAHAPQPLPVPPETGQQRSSSLRSTAARVAMLVSVSAAAAARLEMTAHEAAQTLPS